MPGWPLAVTAVGVLTDGGLFPLGRVMEKSSVDSRVTYALSLSVASVVLNFLTLFVILLRWNTSGVPANWNSVAVSITALEVFLVVTALSGFWLFRGIVKDRAAEVASEVSREIAEAEAAERAEVVAFRAAEAAISDRFGVGDSKIQDLVNAFADEPHENGEQDDG